MPIEMKAVSPKEPFTLHRFRVTRCTLIDTNLEIQIPGSEFLQRIPLANSLIVTDLANQLKESGIAGIIVRFSPSERKYKTVILFANSQEIQIDGIIFKPIS